MKKDEVAAVSKIDKVKVSKDLPSKQESLWSRDLVVISLINFMMFLGMHMTVTGMPIYVVQLGASEIEAGLVITVLNVAAVFARPFTGMMMDRFGNRGVLVWSIIWLVVSIGAFAIFPILGVVMVLRMLQGLGWGVSSTAVSAIAANIVPRSRFAEGMGYFALTIAVTTAIAPALGIALIQEAGITALVSVAAGCTFVALVLAFLLRTPDIVKPEEKMKLSLSSLFDKRALLPSGVIFLFNFAYAAIITFIALLGQARGIDNVYLFFIVYAIATLVSRPLVGRIIDKVGYYLPGILSLLGAAATLAAISFSSDIVTLCIAGAAAGVGLGAGMGTFQAMAVAAVPVNRRGVATSTYLIGFDAGIAVGALVAGAVAGIVGYSAMYLVVAIFPLLALLVFVIAGKKRIARYSE